MLHFSRWKIALILLVCFGSLFLSLPNFLNAKQRAKLPSWFPSQTVTLGLDLQGGSQLLLDVDFDTVLREQIVVLMDDVRNRLRQEKIGYRNLMIKDCKVAFSLRDDVPPGTNIEKVLHKIDPGLEISMAGMEVAAAHGEKW